MQTKVPREVWSPVQDGAVQIQVDENRGVVWVNSGKDGRCLIRICQIPNLSYMLNLRGPWMIDVVSRGQIVGFDKAKSDILSIIYGANWRFKILGGQAAEYCHVDEYEFVNEDGVVKRLLNYLSSILVEGGVPNNDRKSVR